MMKIVKCIKNIEDLDLDKFHKLNIGVEIQDFISFSLEDTSIENKVMEYKELLYNFNNIISLHGPFLDLRPISPDPDIRKVSYDKYLKVLNIAKELKTDYIIFHSQINPYLNEPNLIKRMNTRTKEFWLDIIDKSAYGGMILIENVFEDHPQLLREHIEMINMPNIRVNLDIGHVKLKKVALENWIVQLKDYIEYIHIHSNNGKYDEHKAPTKNEVEQLQNLLQKYHIDPILALEYDIDNIEAEIEKYRI
ncbi:MAG: sugar phosphate isomerase/epimerase [Tissierellia bacterium]|nr:sugar phosphate isomerase/epimerase [Tissierellia bacterium]